MPGFRIARPQGQKAYASGGEARALQAEVARQKSEFFAAVGCAALGLSRTSGRRCGAVLFGRCPVLIIATAIINIHGT